MKKHQNAGSSGKRQTDKQIMHETEVNQES